jgi:hypothetical protein
LQEITLVAKGKKETKITTQNTKVTKFTNAKYQIARSYYSFTTQIKFHAKHNNFVYSFGRGQILELRQRRKYVKASRTKAHVQICSDCFPFDIEKGHPEKGNECTCPCHAYSAPSDVSG